MSLTIIVPPCLSLRLLSDLEVTQPPFLTLKFANSPSNLEKTNTLLQSNSLENYCFLVLQETIVSCSATCLMPFSITKSSPQPLAKGHQSLAHGSSHWSGQKCSVTPSCSDKQLPLQCGNPRSTATPWKSLCTLCLSPRLSFLGNCPSCWWPSFSPFSPIPAAIPISSQWRHTSAAHAGQYHEVPRSQYQYWHVISTVDP